MSLTLTARPALCVVDALLVSLLTLATLCLVRDARAQDFQVISSTPSTGATDVPVETDIVFQFNRALDVNTDWSEVFRVEPRNAISTSRIFLGVDDQNRPSIVEFTVQHQSDRDYVWFVHEVLTATGDPMAAPFVLRYTTASDIGPYQVAGELSTDQPAKRGGRTTTDHIQHILDLTEENGLRGALQHVSLAKTQAAQNGHVLILLLGHYSVRSSSWDVRNATVVTEDAAAYALDYTRDGTYWPLAVKYADGTREMEAVGFYDADGNGAPDSVVVDGGDRSDVDLILFQYSKTTASTYVDQAASAAQEYASDQNLIAVQGQYGTSHEGTAYAWSYDFYSPSQNLLTTVQVDPLEVITDTVTAGTSSSNMLEITEPFIDSDEALHVAEANGGQEFRERFDPEDVVTLVEGGNLYWYYPADPSRVFWRVEYASFGDGGSEHMSVLVDMYTSVVLADEMNASVAESHGLRGNYPNPFSSWTSVDFEVATPSDVRISVYNVLGQRVAVLVDGFYGTGLHSASWDAATAPSGVYIYEMEVGERKESRTMLLVR